MYINCKTNFSLRYGTLTVEQLIKCGVEHSVSSLGLTNINSTGDCWDFVQTCRQHGIKPVVGVEIRNNDRLLYLLIAANNRGLGWINQFLSLHLQTGTPFPEKPQDHSFLMGPFDGSVIYAVGKISPANLQANEFIGVTPWEVNKLFASDIQQYSSKFVVRQPVTFKDGRKETFNIHKLLRAIDRNVLLSKLSPGDLAAPGEFFPAPTEILEAFKQYSSVVTNTYKLIDRCNVDMEYSTIKNKKSFSVSPDDDRELLQKLAHEGRVHRFGNNPAATERVNKELEIIDEMGFNAYFLITWDIVRYAQSRGFYYVGRGSGANSVVAYCLRITDVNPIELNLDFENFLNPRRTSPPDFDIDFSWLDRDAVVDYIFKRYGADCVAMLGSYATFQYNATIRELGKVFGLPKHEIDELGEKGRYYGPSRINHQISDGKQDNMHRLIAKYGSLITGFPHHLSVHAGGILISEEPMYNYTATVLPPKNLVTTQIDMYVAESIGLHKLDILSQRGLGHIKETIRLIKQNRNEDVNIGEVEKFKSDSRVKEQIKNVNTIGCFQIESPTMRQLLKKLKCEDYLTLVAAGSVIRPGVAGSGMMKEYISRYHHPDKVEHLHPVMKDLLQETYGVMVYQEDVIRVANIFGGLHKSDADTLARAMNAKYKENNRLALIRDQFFQNCRQSGYDDEVTRQVWRQMESFAGYSFSKAHSASYAAESFQDLFLKAYFPLEFLVGVINNFGGFYPTPLYFYELIKAGATLHLPRVNDSDWLTDIRGTDVYTGLVHIKGLERDIAQGLLKERERNGPYLHLPDFIERTAITAEQLNTLITVGAFRFTGKNKKQLLWDANFIQKKNKAHVPAHRSLFYETPKHFSLPQLADNPVHDMYDEMEVLGFPLRNPFDLVDDEISNYCPANDFEANCGKTVTALGYFITDKVVPVKNNRTMSFGTFIDPRLNWIDTVHFPGSLQQNPMQGKGFYRITGKVVEDFGAYSVEVAHMRKVGYKQTKYSSL